MTKRFVSTIREITPRPRSKRLRDTVGGASFNGNGSAAVGGSEVAGGGDGHSHSNLYHLNRITTSDKYIEVDDEKAHVGFADEAAHATSAAHAEVAVHSLNADEAQHAQNAEEAEHAKKADGAEHATVADDATKWAGHYWDVWMNQAVRTGDTVQFAGLNVTGDALVGGSVRSSVFRSGIMTGEGWKIGVDGAGELESLVLRSFLEVPEQRFNRVTVESGTSWNAPGSGRILTVGSDEKGDYLLLKLEEGEVGSFCKDDICMGVWHYADESQTRFNATEEDVAADRNGLTVVGFATVYFCVIGDPENYVMDGITYVNGKVYFAVRATNGMLKPAKAMAIVAFGNFTNVNRQKSVYRTRTFTRFLMNQDTWDITYRNVAMQFGDLDGLEIPLKDGRMADLSGYSAYLNNVFFSGHVEELDVADLKDEYGLLGGGKSYSVELSCPVDVVSLDSRGCVIGGLCDEDMASDGSIVKRYRLQTAVTARCNGGLLVDGGQEKPGNGYYRLTAVGKGCECFVRNSTVYVTSIDGTSDGGSTAMSGDDMERMLKLESCCVDLTVECEGGAVICKTYSVTIKHSSTPSIDEESGCWIIEGVRTNFSAKGDDGHAPKIIDGYWWEWNPELEGDDKYHNTGIKAEGKDGLPGSTPMISERGLWVIDGVETSFSAVGDDGHAPKIINGYWYEWNPSIGANGDYQNTGIKAEGKDGTDGKDGADGINGTDGKDGVDGLPGAIVRFCGEWNASVTYVNDEHFVDVVMYGGGYRKLADGETSNRGTSPSSGGDNATWVVFSNFKALAASVLLAQHGYIDVLGAGAMFVGENSNGVVHNADGSTSFNSNAKGWVITNGEIHYVENGEMGLQLTKDGKLSIPSGCMSFKVGSNTYTDIGAAIQEALPSEGIGINLLKDPLMQTKRWNQDANSTVTSISTSGSGYYTVVHSDVSGDVSPLGNNGHLYRMKFSSNRTGTDKYTYPNGWGGLDDTRKYGVRLKPDTDYTFSVWVKADTHSFFNAVTSVAQINLYKSVNGMNYNGTTNRVLINVGKTFKTEKSIGGYTQLYWSFNTGRIPRNNVILNGGQYTAGDFYTANDYLWFVWFPFVYLADSSTARGQIDIAGAKLEEGLSATSFNQGVNALLATGIDIENRQICITADQFEIRDNGGEVNVWVDDEGNLVTRGVQQSLITEINASNFSKKCIGTDGIYRYDVAGAPAYANNWNHDYIDRTEFLQIAALSLDVLCIGDVVNLNYIDPGVTCLWLPHITRAVTVGGSGFEDLYFARTWTRSRSRLHQMEYDEMRHLIGKRLTILNNTDSTIYLMIGHLLERLRYGSGYWDESHMNTIGGEIYHGDYDNAVDKQYDPSVGFPLMERGGYVTMVCREFTTVCEEKSSWKLGYCHCIGWSIIDHGCGTTGNGYGDSLIGTKKGWNELIVNRI